MATMATEPRTTIIREPRVYLVGRQEIADAELARFLADEGVERWTTDTDVAGQKLVEIAGDRALHAIWLEAISTCQRAYRALAEALVAKFPDVGDKTLRRKRAREA